jgi:hypothetical protein
LLNHTAYRLRVGGSLNDEDLLRAVYEHRRQLFSWVNSASGNLLGVAIAYVIAGDPRTVHLHTVVAADQAMVKQIADDLEKYFTYAYEEEDITHVTFWSRGKPRRFEVNQLLTKLFHGKLIQ